jgi:hypothetical protein
MTGPAPFKIVPQSENVEQGKILKVDIVADPGENFKGFIIRAEPVSLPGKGIGSFNVEGDNNVKKMGCDAATLTHANSNVKEKLTIMWQAPTDFTGDILFK